MLIFGKAPADIELMIVKRTFYPRDNIQKIPTMIQVRVIYTNFVNFSVKT